MPAWFAAAPPPGPTFSPRTPIQSFGAMNSGSTQVLSAPGFLPYNGPGPASPQQGVWAQTPFVPTVNSRPSSPQTSKREVGPASMQVMTEGPPPSFGRGNGGMF